MSEGREPPEPHPALHKSAPEGMKCADCQIDGAPCPTCYEAWWVRQRPMPAKPPATAPVTTAELAEMEARHATRLAREAVLGDVNRRILAGEAVNVEFSPPPEKTADEDLARLLAEVKQLHYGLEIAGFTLAQGRDMLRAMARLVLEEVGAGSNVLGQMAKDVLAQDVTLPGVEWMEFVKGQGGAIAFSQHWGLPVFAESFGRLLKDYPDAKNFIESKYTLPGDEGAVVTVTVQRWGGKTPFDMKREAEEARDKEKARADAAEARLKKWEL